MSALPSRPVSFCIPCRCMSYSSSCLVRVPPYGAHRLLLPSCRAACVTWFSVNKSVAYQKWILVKWSHCSEFPCSAKVIQNFAIYQSTAPPAVGHSKNDFLQPLESWPCLLRVWGICFGATEGWLEDGQGACTKSWSFVSSVRVVISFARCQRPYHRINTRTWQEPGRDKDRSSD